MMGTSLLSMPWALEQVSAFCNVFAHIRNLNVVCCFLIQAGFGTGIGLIVLMAVLTLYTAIRVLNSPKTFG
jgi:hypothetical protein